MNGPRSTSGSRVRHGRTGRLPLVRRGRHRSSADPIDPLDVAILTSLQQDGRASLRRVARQVGASVTTVSSRVRNLERLGVLQGFVPLVSVQRLAAVGQSPDCAVLFILPSRSGPGELERVAQEVAQEPNVCYLFQLSGTNELMALASSHSSEETRRTIGSLSKVPGVRRVRSVPILQVHKERPRHPVASPALGPEPALGRPVLAR